MNYEEHKERVTQLLIQQAEGRMVLGTDDVWFVLGMLRHAETMRTQLTLIKEATEVLAPLAGVKVEVH